MKKLCRYCDRLYIRRSEYACCDKQSELYERDIYTNDYLNVDSDCCNGEYFELDKEIEKMIKNNK